MLNPKQFPENAWYHASTANLTPGKDQILPANDDRVGGSNYGYSKHDTWSGGWEGEDRGDYTFAASTEEEAEAWTPSGLGRPVTYVVDPGDEREWDEEETFVMTDESTHAKKRGPMDIVDRIDIPKPDPYGHGTGEVVQGTFGGLNWGQYNKLPDDYTGPATVGPQNHETDNFRRIFPARERMERETAEDEAWKAERAERAGTERRWKEAGQLSLFHGPTASGRTIDMTNRYTP